MAVLGSNGDSHNFAYWRQEVLIAMPHLLRIEDDRGFRSAEDWDALVASPVNVMTVTYPRPFAGKASI